MKNMKNASLKFNIKMMLSVLAALMPLIFAAVPSYAGPGIINYRESVLLDANGGARIFVSLKSALTEEILIPCSLPAPFNAFAVDSSSETSIVIETRGGAKFMKIKPTVLKNGAGIELRYESEGVFDTAEAETKDFGNIEAKYSFVNNTGEKIDSFEVSILLPPEMVVNTVNDYLPKLKKDDAGDPFVLTKKEGRRAIILKVANMKFGERAVLRFNMKSEKRPNAIFIIFMLIAVWYLIMFRDIIYPHGEHKDHKKKKGDKTAGTADAAVSEKGHAENNAGMKKE